MPPFLDFHAFVDLRRDTAMTHAIPLSRNLLALSLGLALAGTAQAQTAPRFSVLAQAAPSDRAPARAWWWR
ncbi:hypothetical protein NB693_22810 [Pantoea ananatis]|uniref:hypothetical protein n=1 Tax=Pantoea ananas TaxID=553 RepID=UPI0022206D07|nr:hypothetical protein [Pantoea ananatis]